ncbi:hypothetical protein BJ508DRAFT_306572 [Ascobolus immersus RN42]|uniref:Uncharacterized protein n=1 Tax=Ascobolus immersus RN42 TaxID=1160509 RepID=A0A3N4IAS5_ASCIM|nr:hypothetical protein BJ508DRAFT_306572 [Ascobolus immersus RN42]
MSANPCQKSVSVKKEHIEVIEIFDDEEVLNVVDQRPSKRLNSGVKKENLHPSAVVNLLASPRTNASVKHEVTADIGPVNKNLFLVGEVQKADRTASGGKSTGHMFKGEHHLEEDMFHDGDDDTFFTNHPRNYFTGDRSSIPRSEFNVSYKHAKPGLGGGPNKDPILKGSMAKASAHTHGTPLPTDDDFMTCSCTMLYQHFGRVGCQLNARMTRPANKNLIFVQRRPVVGEEVSIVNLIDIQFGDTLFIMAEQGSIVIGEVDTLPTIRRDLFALLKTGHTITGNVTNHDNFHLFDFQVFFSVDFSAGQCGVKYRFRKNDSFVADRLSAMGRRALD